MRPTLSTSLFAVYDDFLSPKEHARMWKYFQSESYSFLNTVEWEKVYLESDKHPLLGPTFWRQQKEMGSNPKSDSPEMRRFLTTIFKKAPRFSKWIGVEGRDWASLAATAFLYPPGTGVGWHNDGIRVGAIVYYAHPYWDPNWGGELMLSEIPPRRKAKRKMLFENVNPRVDISREMVEHTNGIFTAVSPRPNRLVLIRGGVPHRIKPVEIGAGLNMRASISGFFYSKEKDWKKTPP
jgi:Rps23 Pro-64 3,4-dihydroxylase Tpa1-like proline 4-hydroxylase